MPLYATLVRKYFGAGIMGTVFGAVAMLSILGMAMGGWIYANLGGYFWLYIALCAIGIGAVAIATTFRPTEPRLRPRFALGQ
jgi:MFS family permease